MGPSGFAHWIKRHPRSASFALSVVLGLLIELTLYNLRHFPIRDNIADLLADEAIRLSSFVFSPKIEDSPGFVLIDIDDDTWLSWHAPLVIPRDKLRDLLARLVRSGAALIIVDVDLAFREESEQGLADLLGAYPANAPVLILVRSTIGSQSGYPQPRPIPGPYRVVTQGRRNILWEAPLFEQDKDGVVRRMWPFTIACNTSRPPTPMILPSMQLMAALIERHALPPPPSDAEEDTQKRLAPFLPDNCNEPMKSAEPVRFEGIRPNKPIVVENENFGRRVIYFTRWSRGETALGPATSVHGIEVPLVVIRPATLILDPAGKNQPLPGVSGRIVVIGGSFVDSGDWYETPVGRMPGALVLINAIESLSHSGTLHEPPLWVRFVVSLVIIIAVAALMAILRRVVGAILLCLAMFFGLGLAARTLEAGVLLDLSVPALGILLADVVVAPASEGLRDLWCERMRWLLRPYPQSTVDDQSRP